MTAAILLLAGSSLGAFWYGWLDFTPAGQLFRAARADLGRGERYAALRRFNEMRVSYPDNRLTRQGQEMMNSLLEEDLLARDRQMARARLELLDRLPESVRRLPQVLTARGDCLYRLGDLTGALALFRQAVEHSPEDGVFRYNLGTAALRAGDARTALEYLSAAAPPLGESPDFCLNSGLAFLLNNRVDDARARFEQAVKVSADRQRMVETTRAAIEDPSNRMRLVAPPRVKSLKGLSVRDADESYRVLAFDLENPEPLTPAVARGHRGGPDLDLVPGEMLLLDEFDLDGATARELECPIGAWVANPASTMTRAVVTYDADQPFGARGQSIKLIYGLETLRFSAAGLWIRLRSAPDADDLDLSRFRYLSLTLRGIEGAPGFSTRAVIELRNRREMSQVELNGITNEWQEFKVPLSQFAGITDRSRMTELLLMVDQATATAFNGALLVDDVKLIQ